MQEFFSNEILPQIVPTIGVVLTAILVTIIKKIGNEAVEYISKKKEVVEQQLNSDKNKELLEVGKQIWNIVEEKFRITENIEEFIGSKAEVFDKLLLEKFPVLTEKQIEQIRQTIAGEINKGKEALSKDTFKEEVKTTKEENTRLSEENEKLKNKLSIISGVIPTEENQLMGDNIVTNTETLNNTPTM